jgi:hypothetical protein
MGQSLFLAFIDLRKAFDSVPHDAFWQVLRACGIPPLLVGLRMDLHAGTQAAVRLGPLNGGAFDVPCCSRQACVVTPLLPTRVHRICAEAGTGTRS